MNRGDAGDVPLAAAVKYCRMVTKLTRVGDEVLLIFEQELLDRFGLK